MEITGNVILWVFGGVFAITGLLISVIWVQLNQRITAIENQAKEDRRCMQEDTDKIYRAIQHSQDSMGGADQTILNKIDALAVAVTQLSVTCASRRGECAERFTKLEIGKKS